MIDTQTDTHTHTDAGNDNTRRPKLASGENGALSYTTNAYEIADKCIGEYTKWNQQDMLVWYKKNIGMLYGFLCMYTT